VEDEDKAVEYVADFQSLTVHLLDPSIRGQTSQKTLLPSKVMDLLHYHNLLHYKTHLRTLLESWESEVTI
jgi:hypothetical protein